MEKKRRQIWLPDIINKITIYLYFFSLLIMFFYFAGNFQSFTDITLITLLALFRYTSLAFLVIGGANMFAAFIGKTKHRHLFPIRFIFTLLGEMLIIALFVMSSIILNFVKGS